jgi:hypothetical protein
MVNGVSAGSMDTYVPPRRTRAQVAAAAKAAMSHMNNGAGSSSSSFIAPPTKKRKRENADDPGAYNGVYPKKPNTGIPSGKQWPGDSGAVTGVSYPNLQSLVDNIIDFPTSRIRLKLLTKLPHVTTRRVIIS